MCLNMRVWHGKCYIKTVDGGRKLSDSDAEQCIISPPTVNTNQTSDHSEIFFVLYTSPSEGVSVYQVWYVGVVNM